MTFASLLYRFLILYKLACVVVSVRSLCADDFLEQFGDSAIFYSKEMRDSATQIKNIPAQLSNNESRYQPYTVIGRQTEAKMNELLQDLEQSKTVLFSFHCTDPNVGMSLNKDPQRYKMFVADTGLL